MTSNKKYGFYYVLSAAATAAAALPADDAAAQCAYCPPTTLSTSMGPQTFVKVGFGSPSEGYRATLVTDNFYGFRTNVAPNVWFDYRSQVTQQNTMRAQLCRFTEDEIQVSCATAATRTTTNTNFQSLAVPVTGLYAPTNGEFDDYVLSVYSMTNYPFAPLKVPSRLHPSW